MKNILILITVLFIVFVSWKVGTSFEKPQGVVRSIQDINLTQHTPILHPDVVITSPKTIQIPSLNLTAAIEHVGLDEKNIWMCQKKI